MADRPLDALEAALGSRVRVRLKEGESMGGVLDSFDQHMNLVLEPPDGDVMDGEIGTDDDVEDTTVIRGDNVVTIET